jgi:hypothetical protein
LHNQSHDAVNPRQTVPDAVEPDEIRHTCRFLLPFCVTTDRVIISNQTKQRT